MSVKKLIILSDLWGKERAQWLSYYLDELKGHFDIQYYDCCELGDIDKSDYSQENLHQQFVNEGIDRAFQQLLELEKGRVNLLAFSVGGTIAWKFGLKSGLIQELYCVSSTRLRHEKLQPTGKITLYFGEKDDFKPSSNWLNQMNVNFKMVTGKGHEMYRDKDFASAFCQELITQKGL
ncbi:MAG: alpha/beta hydrolase [Flavobacteriales bacterium]|nr:alpha/beta hydrolase [Flavobacteriales bacterium]